MIVKTSMSKLGLSSLSFLPDHSRHQDEDVHLGKHISATGLAWVIAAGAENKEVENIRQ